MKYVLDQEPLVGLHGATVAIRPHRTIHCVPDLVTAESMVRRLCQVWGGAANPIAVVEGTTAPPYLNEQAAQADVDGYTSELGSPPAFPTLGDPTPDWGYPAMLIAASEARDRLPKVQVVDLDEDDPWRLAYLGALGTLPEELDLDLCQAASIGPLRIDAIIDVERVHATGSLPDLLDRLTAVPRWSPRQFSVHRLASGQNPDTGYFGPNRILPEPNDTRRAAGPNIVVVMADASAPDLALLWNVRGAWGEGRGLPIGIPHSQIEKGTLRQLREPGVWQPFGWSGGQIFLTSATVPRTELDRIAGTAGGIRVADASELAAFGPAAARHHSTVQTFEKGSTQVVPVTDDDLAVLAATVHRPPSLKVSVRVTSEPVPAVEALRGEPFFAGFQNGCSTHGASLRRNEPIEVRWPTGWTSLNATARSLGFTVTESQPGRAAMSLLSALGSAREAVLLSHPSLLSLFYELAELSGMSWWKRRWREAEHRLRASGTTEDEITEIAAQIGRDTPVIAAPSEGRALKFDRFQRVLGGRESAELWVAWALERRLLVKGVDLKCPSCKAPFWVPLSRLAPPHVCPGCARVIDQPFGANTLAFSYRIGEVLRRCLEADAIGHVLALRWLTQLFGDHQLVGAHPGVEFHRDGHVVAEVDVVLLFADGQLVPVEVKRGATAASSAAIAQLDATSEALGAPWDVICVTEPGPLPDVLLQARRSLPDRPRFLLSMDNLVNPFPVWPLGADPFRADQIEDPDQHWAHWLAQTGAADDHYADPVGQLIDWWETSRSRAVRTSGS